MAKQLSPLPQRMDVILPWSAACMPPLGDCPSVPTVCCSVRRPSKLLCVHVPMPHRLFSDVFFLGYSSDCSRCSLCSSFSAVLSTNSMRTRSLSLSLFLFLSLSVHVYLSVTLSFSLRPFLPSPALRNRLYMHPFVGFVPQSADFRWSIASLTHPLHQAAASIWF